MGLNSVPMLPVMNGTVQAGFAMNAVSQTTGVVVNGWYPGAPCCGCLRVKSGD